MAQSQELTLSYRLTHMFRSYHQPFLIVFLVRSEIVIVHDSSPEKNDIIETIAQQESLNR